MKADNKEAMKLALEALVGVWKGGFSFPHVDQIREAITALRQALAEQPAQQEPVVFYRCNGCGHAYEQVHPTSCDCMEADGFDRVEYYTYPPVQRKPLTDKEQIAEALRRHGLTLIKTASGYDVMSLGHITAHGIKE